MKKVVIPPRTSRPTVERRTLMEKKRSRPFFGLTRGPSLRRGLVTTTSAGVPVSAMSPDVGRDLSGMAALLDGAGDQAATACHTSRPVLRIVPGGRA